MFNRNIRNQIDYGGSGGGSISVFYKSETVSLTFTGATKDPVTVDVFFERIGDTVTFSHPRVYANDQASGYINSSEIPADYWPLTTRIVYPMVINGSAGGATSTQATGQGTAIITTTGIYRIGLSIDNNEGISPFGSGATSGSGNGIMPNCLTYQI